MFVVTMELSYGGVLATMGHGGKKLRFMAVMGSQFSFASCQQQ